MSNAKTRDIRESQLVDLSSIQDNHFTLFPDYPRRETTQDYQNQISRFTLSSPDDALKQMECDKQYSKQSYASHILRYVADNLTEIDLDEVELFLFVKSPSSVRWPMNAISKRCGEPPMVSKWLNPNPGQTD